MHEGSEGSRSPNDRRQKENSRGEVGRSRSTSRVDYERTPSENLEPRNPGDGAGFKPEARLGKGDGLRDAVSEQGIGGKPNVEAERYDDGGPASSGSGETGTPLNSLYRRWEWPNNFEEQSAPDGGNEKTGQTQQSDFEQKKGKGKQTDEEKPFDKVIQYLSKQFMMRFEMKKNGSLTSSREQQPIGVESEALAKELAQVLKEARAQAWTKRLEEEGRGEKTIESASMKKAEEMVDKWRAENLPRANEVRPETVLGYFPEIRLAEQLNKEFQQLAMEQIVLLSNLPEKVRHILDKTRWDAETLTRNKEYNILKESFPKNPEEVIARGININRETLGKADAMVNKWQAEGQPYADQVNTLMVALKFPAIQEATAWEKVSKDVSSAKERLQEAQEKFPKTAKEVWQKNRIEEQQMERARLVRSFRAGFR